MPVSRMVIGDRGRCSEQIEAPESAVVAIDFGKLSRKERREINRRLLTEVRGEKDAAKERRASVEEPVIIEPLTQKVIKDARWLGIDLSVSQAKLLTSGKRMCFDGHWWEVFAGELKSAQPPAAKRAQSLIERMKKAL